MPERIQLSRSKGWRMPANTAKVARPSVWGNPYTVGEFGAELAVKLYRNTILGNWDPALVAQLTDTLAKRAYEIHSRHNARYALRDMVPYLRGMNLACWCKSGPCHADVLLELANA